MSAEEQKAQNKKIAVWSIGLSVVVGITTFVITSLVCSNKYAKLEAKYWGM